MGSVMGVFPGGFGMDSVCAIPGAINYSAVKCGVMLPVASLGQGIMAVMTAIAKSAGEMDGL